MRLIDADKLEKQLDNEKWMDNYDRDFIVDVALDEAPTVDTVPVVRCKDCEHYNTTGCPVGFGWCEKMGRGVSDEFYCSYGAKLEDKSCE